MRTDKRRRWAVLGAAFLVVACAFAWLGQNYAVQLYLEQTKARGLSTLGLSMSSLRGAMGRFENLPVLFADDQLIKQLVQDPENGQLIDQANRSLREANTLLESADIYVLDLDGITIASSNFDTEVSFIGDDFSFRPYYQDAVTGGQGRYFALGATSLKRGYYFSAPIRVGSAILGVMVFKVNIDAIEEAWRGEDLKIVVADEDGVIFMSSDRSWLYTALEPLPQRREESIELSRKYGEVDIAPLNVRERSMIAGVPVLTIDHEGAANRYMVLAETMPDAGWVVHVLLETGSAERQAVTTVIAALLALGLVTAAIAISLERRTRLAERLSMQETAQRLLEHRVAERTADLKAAKAKLELEVSERRVTEQELRKTQSDLVQAGKLAALGQMSAALSHELNQPLTAIRTYAESASTLLDRERHDEARANIDRIVVLAERMAEIGRHLRNFARKPGSRRYAVDLKAVLDDTLEIVGQRLRDVDASLELDLSEGLAVEAGHVRLQQVFVNILSNAADALENEADRRITVTARRYGTRVVTEIRDSGRGIASGTLQRIFDPFYSTKGVGAGLGLGLSISYNIIKDFGGELTAINHPRGGAVFSISLIHASREAADALLVEEVR